MLGLIVFGIVFVGIMLYATVSVATWHLRKREKKEPFVCKNGFSLDRCTCSGKNASPNVLTGWEAVFWPVLVLCLIGGLIARGPNVWGKRLAGLKTNKRQLAERIAELEQEVLPDAV